MIRDLKVTAMNSIYWLMKGLCLEHSAGFSLVFTSDLLSLFVVSV